MTFFWTIWASVILGILLLASFIEWNGARKGFHGANGLFLFASGYLTVLTSPILFLMTWVWSDFWTATKVLLSGALGYALLFALVLKLISTGKDQNN